MNIEIIDSQAAADLIEQAELSGDLVQLQNSNNEIIYKLNDQQSLINTPISSYLISK